MSAFLRAKYNPSFGITVNWAKVNKDGSSSGTVNCTTDETKVTFKVNNNKHTRDQSVQIHKDNGRNGPELALKYTLPKLQNKVFNQYASDCQNEEAFGLTQFHYFGLCVEDMALTYWNEIIKDIPDDTHKTKTALKATIQIYLEKVAGNIYLGDEVIRNHCHRTKKTAN